MIRTLTQRNVFERWAGHLTTLPIKDRAPSALGKKQGEIAWKTQCSVDAPLSAQPVGKCLVWWPTA
jgi:hypothetical protein